MAGIKAVYRRTVINTRYKWTLGTINITREESTRLNTSRAESTGATNSLGQELRIDFFDFGVQDFFEQELCNAITNFDFEFIVAKVEQQDFDLTAIVFIDYA